MVHYQPRAAESSDARLGVVVAKKLLKKAVDRNKIKRVIREQFRCRRVSLPAYDLIVRLATKPKPLDGKILAEEFISLLKKLPKLRPRVQE